MEETVYHSSKGEFVTGSQIWERFESGEWTPCCWNPTTGEEWVGTAADELVALSPVDRATLPTEVHLERHGPGLVVRSD